MSFDFKKEYREFYLPKAKPEIVVVPRANYIAVRGQGDPNEEGGAYQRAIGVLYAVAYTLKMSKRAGHEIEGLRLGGRGGGKEEKARLFGSRISDRRRGPLRADHAHGFVR